MMRDRLIEIIKKIFKNSDLDSVMIADHILSELKPAWEGESCWVTSETEDYVDDVFGDGCCGETKKIKIWIQEID